jgi:hypothetical protein
MKGLIMSNWFGLRCRLKMCGCVTKDDDFGIWGECVECGKRVGYISRVEIRAYMDRETNEAPPPPQTSTAAR